MYRLGKEEIKEVEKLIDTGKLFRGWSDLEEVVNFEKEWAELIGTKYCVCVTGGTPALICALAGMGIGPGDEVIVPGYTFMATAVAVTAVGAVPVIAEIDESLMLDPGDVEKKISKHTKAVIPVHMMGLPADMDRIMAVAEKHGLLVLEDACQMDGGSYKGRRVGSIGHAGAFSFNYAKIIGAGEGGAMVTDDWSIFEKGLIYHDGGIAFRVAAQNLKTPVFAAQQYRVNELTGAVLRVQLSRLDGILRDLRACKKQFLEILETESSFMYSKVNDPEGDCGQIIPLIFESAHEARSFAESNGVSGYLPIDSGKHVYHNWDPILQKRVSHHEALNPFNMPRNRELNHNYSKDMCPVTLDLLERSAFIWMNPDWSDKEIEENAKKCVEAKRNRRK